MSGSGEAWNSGSIDTGTVTTFAHVKDRYSEYSTKAEKLETHFTVSVLHT